ncbi:MAG: DUF5615 family PIN-like protein [Nanoarchaeota archaeon]
MRFIADENIPDSLIRAIRRKGHSVKDIKEEDLAGIDDKRLLDLCKAESRILLTFDKDFTNLQQFPLKLHKGVIVLRYKNKNADNVVVQFCYLLDTPMKDKLDNTLCEVFDNYLKIYRE